MHEHIRRAARDAMRDRYPNASGPIGGLADVVSNVWEPHVRRLEEEKDEAVRKLEEERGRVSRLEHQNRDLEAQVADLERRIESGSA